VVASALSNFGGRQARVKQPLALSCWLLAMVRKSDALNESFFRTLKTQCPISEISNKTKTKFLKLLLRLLFCSCDLCVRFIWDLLLFDIWDFRLAPLDGTYPTGLVRFRRFVPLAAAVPKTGGAQMKRKHFFFDYIPVAFVLLSFLFSACSGQRVNTRHTGDAGPSYANAVTDAEIAEPNEISRDLIAIVDYNQNLVWRKGNGAQPVLMLTWTNWDGYDNKEGESMNLSREVWVTAVPELRHFCKEYSGMTKLTLRLEQLLGLPPDNGKTRFIEMWVSPNDLFRPSPDPEITDREAELDFPHSNRFLTVSAEHIKWFNYLKSSSYGENGYPWTRLGYTYDWGNPESDIGLSEFVIRPGAIVEIHSVSKLGDYCR